MGERLRNLWILAKRAVTPVTVAGTLSLSLLVWIGAVPGSVVAILDNWNSLFVKFAPADPLTKFLNVIDDGNLPTSLSATASYLGKSSIKEASQPCEWDAWADGNIDNVREVRLSPNDALLILGGYRTGCLIYLRADKPHDSSAMEIGWPEYIYVHEVSPASPGKIIEIRNVSRFGSGIWGMNSTFVWTNDKKINTLTLPTYMLVSGWDVFSNATTEFLMRNVITALDGVVTLRRDGTAYACDQTKEQQEKYLADRLKEVDALSEAPDLAADAGNAVDTGAAPPYLDRPVCTEPYETMKAIRLFGPEVLRFDPVTRQFDLIDGRRSEGASDLAEVYGDKAGAKGHWFTSPPKVQK